MKKMSPTTIKGLLDKYLAGKTSIEDERTLIEFFKSEVVPKEFEQYKSEFQYYAISREEEPGDMVQNTIDSLDTEIKNQTKSGVSVLYKVAATFLLVAVSFLSGYSVNVKTDVKEEVLSLRKEMVELKETTVKVMLQGESSHQRIQALVIASQIQLVTNELLDNVLTTFNEDNSPIVRSVALEFLGIHRDTDRVRSALISSLLNQNLLSLQVELLFLIQKLDDRALTEQLEDLLENKEIKQELKEEIKKMIQNDQTASI